MSAAAIVRCPPLPCAVIWPSTASTTAGRSEAGSPWASEPPIVPRLRTCWSAISDAARLATPSSGASWRSAWRVIEPIRQSPF